MKFTKMHSLGNDYIYIDLFTEKINDPFRWAKFLSHRRYGVGSDGLVLIGASDIADFSMRIFNVDGSEAQMCGNALRSVGKYVYIKKYTLNKEFTIETLAGIKKIYITDCSDQFKVKANIGSPIFDYQVIPCTQELIDHPYSIKNETFYLNSISMGNPHCVIFTNNLESLKIEEYGPILEDNEFYPEKTNVEFVEVIDRNTLKMRVWERGCGETWACGTGCSAAAAISILHNYTNRKMKIFQLGGVLDIEWSEIDGSIYMESDAQIVYSGEVDINALEQFERIIEK